MEKKGLVAEFKEFIMRGNVLDMAVGVIIGGAFGSIVSSLVDDVIMPIITLITGGINFDNWFIALNGQDYATLAAAQEAGASTLNYGVFITKVINFLILSTRQAALQRRTRSRLRKLRQQRSARSASPRSRSMLYAADSAHLLLIRKARRQFLHPSKYR